MHAKLLVLGMVALMGIRGCGDKLPDLPNELFVLQVNEVYPANGFKLKLTSIQDSRCPKGVECVWAGNAQVEVAVMSDSPDTLHLCLGACMRSTGSKPSQATDSDTLYHNGQAYLLTLLEVNPYPVYEQKQAEKEAKFRMEEIISR